MGAQRREQESRSGREPHVGREYLFHSLREEAEAPEWSLESMDQSEWFRLGYKAISRKLRGTEKLRVT